MARRYDIRATNGALFIPVADGEYFTADGMSTAYTSGQCIIAFYNQVGDDFNLVTPGAGTFVFRSASIEGQFNLPSNSGATTDATAVVAGNADTYEPAVFGGRVIQTNVTLSGVAGATHFRGFHWRYNL